MSEEKPFKLILLNMPIGSPLDVNTRVLSVLREQTLFAVEDTRSFKYLLNQLGISLDNKKIYSFHDQSTEKEKNYMVELAKENGVLFYASEAGSPCLSDPAYPLIQAILLQGGEVESYSGISAVTMALELSGLPSIPFTFHGFLARDEGPIKHRLEELKNGTHIFFESPHRLDKLLEILNEMFPKADLVILKELTKPFQTIWRGSCESLFKKMDEMVIKGEFVLVLYLKESDLPPLKLEQQFNHWIENGGGQKDLAKILSDILRKPTKEIYQKLIQLKG